MKQANTALRRTITLPLLVFYGVGTILGAGVYALIGKVVGLSGIYAPFSFLLAAMIASLVAYAYAQLSRRYPQSAGEAVYVKQAFAWPWLTVSVGWGIAMTGVVSAAVMARGFQGYLNEFVQLPAAAGVLFFVLLITVIALIGISLSARVAALVTVIELSGIAMIIVVAWEKLGSIMYRWPELLPPLTWDSWQSISLGAFLAFYAYIGFEDMVNIAEEIVNPEDSLPTAITLCLLITTLCYVLVALIAVLSLPLASLAESSAPFVLIVQENSTLPVYIIGIISLFAIFNGALVQLIMASRVVYGLAMQQHAPEFFRFVHPKSRTPVYATLFFAAILLLLSLYFPIESLAKATSFIILIIFALVCLSLGIIRWRENQHKHCFFLVPAAGFLFCVAFVVQQIIHFLCGI